DDPQGKRDQERDAEARQREVESWRHAAGDQTERRRVRVPRLPEIPLDGAAGELPVLHVDRAVETGQLGVALGFLLARVLREQQEDGVADDVEDGEREHRDPNDDDDELQQLAERVPSHGRRPAVSLIPSRTERDTAGIVLATSWE